MWACRPILTPGWVVGIFLIIGVIFIPIGAACLAASRNVVEVRVRYDDQASCTGGKTTRSDRDAAIIAVRSRDC